MHATNDAALLSALADVLLPAAGLDAYAPVPFSELGWFLVYAIRLVSARPESPK